jgi:hypothetical protein
VWRESRAALTVGRVKVGAAEAARDDEVLTLRDSGLSFTRIARDLGLQRGVEATEAFNRALRRRPTVEQRQLRADESARLDILANRVQQNPRLSAPDKARQLQVVEELRRRLLAVDEAVAEGPMDQ